MLILKAVYFTKLKNNCFKGEETGSETCKKVCVSVSVCVFLVPVQFSIVLKIINDYSYK